MLIALYVVAGIVAWIICGTVNHIAAKKLMGEGDTTFLIMCGPMGSVMLLIVALMMGLVNTCKTLARAISPSSAASE